MLIFRRKWRRALRRRAANNLIFTDAACVLGCARPPASGARRVDSFARAGWTPRELQPGDNAARQAALDLISRGGRVAIVRRERTFEGDPAPSFLLAEGDRVRILFDLRRDRWSELRSRMLWETRVDSLTLGYVTELSEPGREYAALSREAARTSLRSLLLLGWARNRVVVAF